MICRLTLQHFPAGRDHDTKVFERESVAKISVDLEKVIELIASKGIQ
jgi:hypothetical protein